MYARYLAEMLGIMGDYGQTKMTSSNSYKNIEWKNSIHVSVSTIKPFIVD